MTVRDRLASRLRRRVLTGYYRPGERLPSMWRLADEAGVTEPVAYHAVSDLCRAGLLRTVPGVGTWVVDDIADAARMQSALDELRAAADADRFWSGAGAVWLDGDVELVPFPAEWIQRLLDERAELLRSARDAG